VATLAARRCETCGGSLGPSRSDRRFCGPACRQRSYRQRNGHRQPQAAPATSLAEPNALEQLLDVQKLTAILVKHAYGGHPTSWRYAHLLLQTLYPDRWDPKA
jgi:hypothetical protein